MRCLFPKREHFSPLNFHGHKCHVLHFLIAIGLKIISIFLSSGKSVREKGKAVGKELLLAPSAGSTSSFASNSTQLAPSTATPPAGAVLLPDRCWSIRGFTSWDRKGESFGDGQAQGGTLEDSG